MIYESPAQKRASCENEAMSKKWIDDAVAGIAGREQQSRERMSAAANARAEYGEIGPKFWAEFVSSIEAGVSEFNGHYPENPARQQAPDLRSELGELSKQRGQVRIPDGE
jgi:hypothetical protein